MARSRAHHHPCFRVCFVRSAPTASSTSSRGTTRTVGWASGRRWHVYGSRSVSSFPARTVLVIQYCLIAITFGDLLRAGRARRGPPSWPRSPEASHPKPGGSKGAKGDVFPQNDRRHGGAAGAGRCSSPGSGGQRRRVAVRGRQPFPNTQWQLLTALGPSWLRQPQALGPHLDAFETELNWNYSGALPPISVSRLDVDRR